MNNSNIAAILNIVLFVLHYGLFIPIGKNMLQTLKIKESISDSLGDELICVKCCQGLFNRSLCEEMDCKKSRISGNKQCVWNNQTAPESSFKGKLISTEESFEIIRKAYDRLTNLDKPTHGHTTIGKLEKIVESPNRPSAYLTSFQTNGAPTKGRSRLMSWSNQRGAGFCYRIEMEYSNETGLIIKHTGRYVVYVHTTFITKKGINKRIKPSSRICTVSHEVVTTSAENHNRTLIKSSETRNCNVNNGFRRKRHTHKYHDVGFFTMHTMGIFELKFNDKLQ
uniref:THD domain-containing protein n=1 Tax=Ciona savignyi TaxID=51511 RepID=H2ZPQ9_CIOSA